MMPFNSGGYGVQGFDPNTLWKSMQDYFSKTAPTAQPAPVTPTAPGQDAWNLMTSGKQFMPNFLSGEDRTQFLGMRPQAMAMPAPRQGPAAGYKAPPDSYPAQIAAMIAGLRRGRPLA